MILLPILHLPSSSQCHTPIVAAVWHPPSLQSDNFQSLWMRLQLADARAAVDHLHHEQLPPMTMWADSILLFLVGLILSLSCCGLHLQQTMPLWVSTSSQPYISENEMSTICNKTSVIARQVCSSHPERIQEHILWHKTTPMIFPSCEHFLWSMQVDIKYDNTYEKSHPLSLLRLAKKLQAFERAVCWWRQGEDVFFCTWRNKCWS